MIKGLAFCFLLIVGCSTISTMAQCPPNSVYTDCGSACPPTCESPSPGFCIQMCVPESCECFQGFLQKNGRCVRPYEC
ncbi:chymotrypsin inhibitor [Copidosoma floridanum]|uniref:chymotrypsin inhibitor n=1 Tax=Copidosoma floridanum TaxID=29053 RepID=UPI0006C9854C|nr:chymotrypsin inhibitor [Copidosoma floridanum]